MATYNPFLDPDFVNGPVRPRLNGTVQSAPQPQPQQPQLPAGVGDLLANVGQAYLNQGLAAPGHGRNQNIADRAVIEREAAFQQRAAFNEAFPRGRGADGLVEVPKIDQALANRAYAARRAGGDPRRPVGDNNLKVNQEQTGFQMLPGKTPDGAQRRVSTWAPPLSLGGVLAPSYQAPANTGRRGGDFRDPKTGAVSGLIDYQAPDGVKYTDANVWTVAPIPESDPRGPGIYDSSFMPPAKLAEMQHVRDRVAGKRGGPITPPPPLFTPVAAGGAKAPPVAVDPMAAAITAMLDREVAQSRAREMAEIQAAFQPLPAPATAPATVGDAITPPPAEVPPAAPAAPAAGPRPFETPEAVQARLMLEEQARQDQLAEQAKKQQEAKRRAEEQARLAAAAKAAADQRALELSKRNGNRQQEPWRPGAQRGNPNQ